MRIFTLAAIALMGVSTYAAKVESDVAKNQPAKAKVATGREHNFEDLLVQGKYHFSDEAVTTVEEDKVLDSLLGLRTDFKDRMRTSTGWD